ncbi:hypothetical protein MAR_029725 [Mya arenaria]|uniref:Uncharacterized protein n=1 Tax=Mya arenaria TaxID=6604 RepID=A0ABY7DK21_MYAAR|nr:hypothetical protein MAR_029725 [Mya arenaria]
MTVVEPVSGGVPPSTAVTTRVYLSRSNSTPVVVITPWYILIANLAVVSSPAENISTVLKATKQGKPPYRANLKQGKPPYHANQKQVKPPYRANQRQGKPPYRANLKQEKPPYRANQMEGKPPRLTKHLAN